MGDKQYIVAIDVGTTGTKTLIFNLHGCQIIKVYKEIRMIQDEPGQRQQNALDWWRTTYETARKAIRDSDILPKDIVAIGITAQRGSHVPVDAKGRPLCNGFTWQDRTKYSTSTYYYLDKKYFPLSSQRSSKYEWFKENHPEIHAQIYKFVNVDAFISYYLTGKWGSSPSSWSYLGLLDRETHALCKERSELLRTPLTAVPPVYPSGTVLGSVTKKAARETGFAEGTPVVIGAGDQQSSSIGTGVITPEFAQVTIGTGTFVESGSVNEYKIDPEVLKLDDRYLGWREPFRLICSGMPTRKWVYERAFIPTGMALRWFRDMFYPDAVATYQQLGFDNAFAFIDDQAETVPPTSEGLLFLPYFFNALQNPNTTGVIFGLTYIHSKRHVARALLESSGYETRRSLEVFANVLGLHFKALIITGGGGRSRIWCKIHADITGLPVLVPKVFESSALGTAILAAYGVGLYKDIDQAVKSMVCIANRIEPDPETHKLYDKYWEVYKKIYMSLLKTFDRHVEIKKGI